MPMLRKIPELAFSSRGRACVFGALLAAVTIFAYRPAWNGGFLWDDDDYIIKNDLLTASDGLRRSWLSLDSPSQYFPPVYTTFLRRRAIWGLHPSGSPLLNLLVPFRDGPLARRDAGGTNRPVREHQVS